MSLARFHLIEETLRNYDIGNHEFPTLLLLTHLIPEEYEGVSPISSRNRGGGRSNSNRDENESEDEVIKRVLEQSLKESEDDAKIKAVFDNPQSLKRILSKLEGVNPEDPIFNEFYENWRD